MRRADEFLAFELFSQPPGYFLLEENANPIAVRRLREILHFFPL